MAPRMKKRIPDECSDERVKKRGYHAKAEGTQFYAIR